MGTSACTSALEIHKGWLDRREAQEIAGPQGLKAPAEIEVQLLSEFPSDTRMIIDLTSLDRPYTLACARYCPYLECYGSRECNTFAK